MANMEIVNDKVSESEECNSSYPILSMFAGKVLLEAKWFTKHWESIEKCRNTRKIAKDLYYFYKKLNQFGETFAPKLEKFLDECDMKEVEESLKKIPEIEEDIHKLSEQIERMLSNKSNKGESENDIDSLRELCCNIIDEVTANNSVQSVLSEDLQLQLNEKNEQRQQLLDDLKRQEEAHLQEVEQLKKDNKTELEARDMRCLELEQEIERLRGDNEINLSCSICLEPWSSESAHRLCCLPCGHLFGSTCIQDHLQRCAECPQCRAPTNATGMRFLYGRPY